MSDTQATPLRRLLAYAGDTAGGLMTPEPLVVTAETTVAEVLARMRDPELPPGLAAQVFVVEPPTETPTGRYIGAVGFQRLRGVLKSNKGVRQRSVGLVLGIL